MSIITKCSFIHLFSIVCLIIISGVFRVECDRCFVIRGDETMSLLRCRVGHGFESESVQCDLLYDWFVIKECSVIIDSELGLFYEMHFV